MAIIRHRTNVAAALIEQPRDQIEPETPGMDSLAGMQDSLRSRPKGNGYDSEKVNQACQCSLHWVAGLFELCVWAC